MNNDTELLAAHAAGDKPTLVTLYSQTADTAEPSDIDAACFYLTQAFIFALDCGDLRADDLRARLIAYGREVAL